MTVLEPKLTAYDLRVLRVVPEGGEDWLLLKRKVEDAATVWEIAERLDTLDLHDLLVSLRGFKHLDYVFAATSKSRRRTVYWRTAKGDAAVNGEAQG